MKKFKKSLLINVPQDDDHGPKSPSRIGLKQNKQKFLLLFNEHTISSSANNNEDDPHQQDDKQMTACQQFVEHHTKEVNEKKKGLPTDVQQTSSHRLQKNKKFNIIEFEQFMVEGDIKTKHNETEVFEVKQKRLARNNHKRSFSIEIPQQKQERQQQMSIKFAFDLKNNQHQSKQIRQSGMKEPPAPSNKTSQGKGINRKFVFPTNDEQEIMYHKQSFEGRQKFAQKIISKQIAQEDHEIIVKQLNMEWKEKLEMISKSFQKQRQQFYKQKSRLQKDLMIKDGQIEMLQKLITSRYSPTNQTNNNYGDNLVDSKRETVMMSPSIIGMEKSISGGLYVTDEKITAMETVLLEKDLEVNSLLEKINQLGAIIEQKNNQLEDVKVSLLKSQKMNQSLRNEIFIHEKKEQSEKLTKQFYKVKQSLIQVQKSTKTPKAAFSRSKWQQDPSLQQKQKDFQKVDYPFRGIDDLHKRLQSLKMNRIELQSRGRIKSEMNYPQTSKNKTKGTFDFKGKFYDRQREFNLRGGVGY